MKIFVTVSISFLLIIILFSCVQDKITFSILSIDEQGGLNLFTAEKSVKIHPIPFLDRHQLIGGYFYDGCFYFMDKDNKIFKYNIQSQERHVLVSLNEKDFPKNDRYKIRFVNENIIIFSHYPRYLYKIERKNSKIIPIRISNNRNTNISHSDNGIYYSNYGGEIAFFDGKVEKSLGIKGEKPTVSPNGRYIAFTSQGFLSEKICILTLDTNKVKTVDRFYSCSNNRIRWSSDSRLLSLHPVSEFSLKPFFIIDVQKMEIVYKSKKVDSVNWFFFGN